MNADGLVILIIDDSKSDRRIFKRYIEEQLARNHPRVIEAPTARAGLEACATTEPDCILLDYQLPDIDGVQLISKIRNITNAPILFVTGHPEPLTETQAYRYGASSFLSKDFLSSASLVKSIRGLLPFLK